MRVLSLFDGCGGARVALDNLGVDCDYYSYETDKYAVSVHTNSYPTTRQYGDVHDYIHMSNVDLLIGGSPCQSLSSAKRQKESGLEEGSSKLFYKYVEILEKAKPKYFVFENVFSMKTEDKDKISSILGVQPIKINSSLLTGQLRNRLYWTNIKGIEQPEDKDIRLQDILENGCTDKAKSYCLTASYGSTCPADYFRYGHRQMIFKKSFAYSTEKSKCINISIGGKQFKISISRDSREGLDLIKPFVRLLTPIECERLQGLPDNYTQGVSKTQRYKMIGNGFTIPVISHILGHIPGIKKRSK